MKVVMYHYIRPLKSSMIKGLKALDSEIFYKQLKFLNTEFDIINHYDLYNYFTKDINLPPKPLLLTFDDGYLDVFRYVFPALQANNLKGSFYVPDYFNNRTLLDVNAIHLLLTKHEFIVFYLQYIKKYYNDNISKRNFQDYTCSINTNSRFDTKEVVLFKKLLQYILPEFQNQDYGTVFMNIFLQSVIDSLKVPPLITLACVGAMGHSGNFIDSSIDSQIQFFKNFGFRIVDAVSNYPDYVQMSFNGKHLYDND